MFLKRKPKCVYERIILILIIVTMFLWQISGERRPKLSVISPQTPLTVLNDKTTIDLKANTSIRLKCEGTEPIDWSFPDNDPESPPISSLAKINSKCNRTANICISDVFLQELHFWQTGLYSCHYNQSKDSFDSIYVFINDPDNLIVPIDGSDEFIIVPVLENSTSIQIACKPTDSRALVTLHLYDSQTENFIQMANEWLRYDPTIGFDVQMFKFKQYNALDCKVKLGKREQYIGVTVHEIKQTHIELYPYINVVNNRTQVGDNVTLICSVNIEGNTFIDISWYYRSDFSRKIESSPETVTKQTSGGVFETVSRSLTILNATQSDSDIYMCNVTDFSEHTYSASKKILITNPLVGNIQHNCGQYVGHSILNQKLFICFCSLILILNNKLLFSH